MHSRYYATTRIYEDGASCGFVVTLRYRLAAGDMATTTTASRSTREGKANFLSLSLNKKRTSSAQSSGFFFIDCETD